MIPSKDEILLIFKDWLLAWNEHNLNEVMKIIHEDIVFENWNGVKIVGKKALQRSWMPWFLNHEDFKFFMEDVSFDENEQKMIFLWSLKWPSRLNRYKGKSEIRRGVDILHFMDGKIIQKQTYSKTTIEIEGFSVSLEK
jgi:hypothetical protein